MLAIVTAATKSYLYAFRQCLRGIAAAGAHHKVAHFIFATDDSKESKEAEKMAKEILPEGWVCHCLHVSGLGEDTKDYKVASQIRIAKLQGEAFHVARSKVRADMVWSVESDVIVKPNSLRVLEWALGMPTENGSPLYDVAAGTYVNGLFLGGFGTEHSVINQDFLPHERVIPPRLARAVARCAEIGQDMRFPDIGPERRSKERSRADRLNKRMMNCAPDGTIWEVIAKHGWRRRGWFDFAYPGIGEGAMVPIDWCGLGCTLMSSRALALAEFSGYNGEGTQDLYLCWRKWYPSRLRIACVPHVVCDHVKREGEEFHQYVAYHEQNPEMRGHLRVRKTPWVPL